MKKILYLTLILLIAFVPAYSQLNTDKTIPSVFLKDLNGQQVDLKDYASADKLTVISFWATWCAPCKKELENLDELMEEWEKEYEAQLVAISVDNARNSMKVKPYVQGKGWTFTVLLDENSDTQRTLNWPSIPYTIVIDKSGSIVYRHSGYSEGDEFVLEEKLKELSGKK
jgi:cytochrome c biogenesis protein CcmG, thiol:disulfide interchange protein DsbE